MNKLWKRYNAWRHRRQQSSLERWAETRAKGKGRFVLYQAFSFAVLMTASRDILNQFYGVAGHISSLWFYFVVNVVTGYFVGCMGWRDREGKYKNAQLNSHLQKPFDDRILPH